MLPDEGLIEYFQQEEKLIDEYWDVIARFRDMNIDLEKAKWDTQALKLAREELIIKIQKDIALSNKKIQEKETELEQINASIELLNQEVTELIKKQATLSEIIKKLTLRSYSETLESDTDITLIGVLLDSTFGDKVRESETQSIMQATTASLIGQQKKQAEKISGLQLQLQKKQEERKNSLDNLSILKLQLSEAQELESELLDKDKARERSLTNDINRNNVKTSEIEQKFEQAFTLYESKIQEYSTKYGCQKTKNTICDWIDSYLRAEKNLRANTGVEKSDVWPISPIKKWFWYHFKDQQFYYEHDSHHTGVDFLWNKEEGVKSINDGYILFIREQEAWKQWIIIIKHKHGRISVYNNITWTQFKTFDIVKRGDIIGHLWNIWHDNRLSLHFELYKNTTIIDPLESYSLAGVPTKFVPKRYGWKYIDDRKKIGKSVDLEKIQKEIGFFYVAGENELDRQSTFLQTYASGYYNNVDIWREESLAENIDPSMIMCIGFAESSLWQNLTTDNNIGNVGNTDGGDRRAFSGPRAWIRAIANTLNNGYLGRYTTINQLSGWWNTTGPIYASSPTNWHENIVKCLSALKWTYVGNQAVFRLSQAQLLAYQKVWYSLNIGWY